MSPLGQTLPGTVVRASKDKAFTLVELLVVIAIIAILAALLLPALATKPGKPFSNPAGGRHNVRPVPNYPTATNPAMATGCHAEGKLRRFVDRDCWAAK